MRKVLLINSPLFRDRISFYDEDSLPPIGLGYIATALKEAGVKVELVDAVAQHLPLTELLQIVTERDPDYLAINVFTSNLGLVKELVESLKNPRYSFIVGGLSTRTLQQEIFSWKTGNQIDVVFGDGERITPDIVLERVKESPTQVAKRRRFFSVTNQSTYFITNISDIHLDRNFFVNEPIRHPHGFVEAHILTSRGCIYNCAFCAAARAQNRDLYIRERGIDSIIQELRGVRAQFPEVTSIRVLDDLFLKNKKSIAKAVEIFSCFSYQWRAMAHVMTFKGVDHTSLLKLTESGCRELFIGIESGSPAVLKRIRKIHDIDTIKTSISNILRSGISVKGWRIQL